MAREPVAVLLMAYGGPGSLAEVEPYLRDVRGGRATPPELVADVRARYERIGGRSPILDHTEAQAAGLRRALGDGYAVYVGMRHWHPYIRDTVERVVADAHRRVLGLVLAPHYSALSVGEYERQLLHAANGRLETALVRSWGDHPGFLDAVARRVDQALGLFPSPRTVHVVFTAHSLPRRVVAAGDPYPEQILATARAVAGRLALTGWELAYQSAGATPDEWLGPDAGAVLERRAREGREDFLIAPIGFVCDHVEILYDVDVAYHAIARRLGVRLERTQSLNDDPAFIAVLADLVTRAVGERGWRA